MDAPQFDDTDANMALRASALWLELAGISLAAIKKQLLHNETDTTAVHYANAPPLQATFELSGWSRHGGITDFDPKRQDLHAALISEDGEFYALNDMVVPFYSHLMAHAKAQGTAQSTWRTIRGFAHLVKHAVAGMIETAAQLRINSDARSSLPVYSGAPWNGNLFRTFVNALNAKQNKRDTLANGTKQAAKLLRAEKVIEGLTIMATAIQKSQAESEKRRWSFELAAQASGSSGGGINSSSSSDSGVAAATRPADMMDADSYPDSCLWAREPQIFPNPNVKTIQDCHDDWNSGCDGGPPLQLLEEKYKFNWRKKNTKIAKVISMYRNIATACENTSVDAVQQELYTHFKATSASEKLKCQNATRLREFHDKVLVPRQPGYASKSAAASLVRKKGLQNAALNKKAKRTHSRSNPDNAV